MNYDEINSNNSRDPFTLCLTFKKTVRIMENPTLPTIWLMPLSNAPQCPGFQESEQETDPATSDFWNPTLTAHMMVLDFRNPDKKG